MAPVNRGMLNRIARTIRSATRSTWVATSFLDARKVFAWRDIRAALRAGLKFRPLETTAAETLAWFNQKPAERRARLKAGLAPAREAALLEQWNASSAPRG